MDSNLVWFILINPLIAAVLVHACLRKAPGTCAAVSGLSSILRLVAGIGVWFSFSRTIGQDPGFKFADEIPWLDFGTALRVPIGLVIDRLSAVMVLVVTGVGALIHIYSVI